MESTEISNTLLQEEIEKKALKIAEQLDGLSYYDIKCILKEIRNIAHTMATIKF